MGRAPVLALLPPLLMALSITSSRAHQRFYHLHRTRNYLSPSFKQQFQSKNQLPLFGPWRPKVDPDFWPFSTFGHRERRTSNDELYVQQRNGLRQYDVPQIECPPAEDGTERYACPTPDRLSRYRCIDDHELCDGFIDCPQGEDEDRQACMFYKTTKTHLDVLADALLRWARGRF
ncbi:uncharacterized protein LOC143247775 [Tachypleus tridentatus]|uniref:uncharacterized protein LOC143247775 n=1 Tax=Tachypleus tridentatus TaxID=6853 RepID=UPI003FD15B8C